jgi:biotin-(acetyl-CoA carboxylase) ligase
MVSTSAFTEKYLNQLYRFNQKTPFKDANSKFVGSIKGIGEFGELLIEDEKGCFRKYSFKEIEMLI